MVVVALIATAVGPVLKGGPPDNVPETNGRRPADVQEALASLNAMNTGDTISARTLYAVTGKPRQLKLPSLEEQERAAGSSRLTIPALNASLPIASSSVTRGVMQVPPGVSRIGWLTSSAPLDGVAGVSVLATHRDTGGGGRGVRSPFYGIEHLRRGARLEVKWRGTSHIYRVVSQQRVHESALPRAMMRRGGRKALVLVMCGGPLQLRNDGKLHWTERLLIWANETESH